ncbi:MAG: hypothetical protein Q8904_15775 [Bacteroidota bacterium]|nr:hypothetical protein [Bacteroidota bacterium]
MKDFTLRVYRQLLETLQKSGYSFCTFEDWCDGKADDRYVILRHDVDLKVRNSLDIARIEAAMGIRATYYFRVIPQSNQRDVINSIAGLGHEIGYHYEDLSLFHGHAEKAIEHFKIQLEYFRQFYPVRTICMHGSPISKWDNRDLWKTYDYRDYDLIGEPYFDFLKPKTEQNAEATYFTDTARMWDGDKYNIRDKSVNSDKGSVISDKKTGNGSQLSSVTVERLNDSAIPRFSIHSTFDLINWFKSGPDQNGIMITTHPQRWSDKAYDWFVELIMQHIKNFIKHWFLKIVR